MSLYSLFLLLGCILYVTAFPKPDPLYYAPKFTDPFNPKDLLLINRPTFNPNKPPTFLRVRRFTDGSQRYNGQNPQEQKRPDWEIKPELSRDQRGNTNGQVTIQKHGENHDLEAGWGQTIRGPNKHSETWHAGGSIRW